MADVHVVMSLDQLGEHAEAWDRLAMASADRLPMLSHAWVSSFLEHRTVDGSPWQCFFAYEGAELVGVLPLVGERGGVLPRMQGPADSHTAIRLSAARGRRRATHPGRPGRRRVRTGASSADALVPGPGDLAGSGLTSCSREADGGC